MLMARESSCASHAANTRFARNSRRCSCGWMSFGSSLRLPSTEVSDGLAFVEARGRYVNAPLTVARRQSQHRIEVALVEAAPPRGVADGRLVGDRDPGRIHPDRIDVLDVISERVVHQRANQLGAGGQLRVIDRIDFELKPLARVARVFRRKPGWKPLDPCRHHDPVGGVEALELVRSPGDLRDRQIADADAVGEPARVRHLVQGVHVDGADRLAVAGDTNVLVRKS